jgi:hypothetical protein
MAWNRLKSFVGLGPSKEEQAQQLELLKQQMKVGTPVQQKQKEIEYNKLFYKLYPGAITEQAYTEQMNKLNEELRQIEKKMPSPLLEGWEPADNTLEQKNNDEYYDQIYPLGGKKKTMKSKQMKRTKSKQIMKSKQMKSKQMKSKQMKRTKSKRMKK